MPSPTARNTRVAPLTAPKTKTIAESKSSPQLARPEKQFVRIDRGESLPSLRRTEMSSRITRFRAALTSPSLIFKSLARFFLRMLDRPGLEPLAMTLAQTCIDFREAHLDPADRLTVGREAGVWYTRKGRLYLTHRHLHAGVHPHAALAEASDLYFHRYRPKKGDTVVNVGAGTGLAALAAAQEVGPEGLIYAIEAHPLTYNALKLMCRLNHLPNVFPRRLAISESSGIVHIEDNMSTCSNSTMRGRGSLKTEAISLDLFASAERIKTIDLLIMNIEGAEREAIRGMDEVLRRVRHICVSCHDFRADEGDGEIMRTQGLVTQFLKAHGFRTFFRLNDIRPSVRCIIYAENALLK